jgi:phosphodiesterase/alkaline phosphatase D-like protein
MKNIWIGVLIIVVLGLGIYAITKSDVPAPADTTVNTDTGTDTNTNTNTNTGTDNTGSTGTQIDVTPRAPEAVTSSNVNVTSTNAFVTGQVKPDGANTSYWFEYGTTSSLGQKTVERTIGGGFVQLNTPENITGLKSNTTYYYRVAAKNSFGTVSGNTLTFTTNTAAPAVGKAPTTTTKPATSLTRTGATINAQVNPNGFSTSYWFEYGTNVNMDSQTGFQNIGNASTSSNVSASLSGLAPQTKYYYRINAQNQFGTVNGTIMSFTTSGPLTITTPAGTVQGNVNNKK